MSVIGWYGPLINLSEASLHIGDLVQLLVFIHRSTPVQYKFSKGGEVIRTDIKVADDTKSFFTVSLWQKKMAAAAFPGDVVLLQNVKLRKFGDVIEATTVHCSSLVCIIHRYETLISQGINDIMANCRVGLVAKEKLEKVVQWAQSAGSTFHNMNWRRDQENKRFFRNWKLPEKRISKDCCLLSEVLCLTESCEAILNASIGEIFLLLLGMKLDEAWKEKMFISRRLYNDENFSLAEDLFCTGCQLCGSPLGLEIGPVVDQNSVPLYCPKSSNRLHAVSTIYRPFMLYVWDESECIPLLVKNHAAEVLFGNIKAEKVYSCYRGHKLNHDSSSKAVANVNHSDASVANSSSRKGERSSYPPDDEISRERKKTNHPLKSVNFYLIWLIFLRMLLQQDKNSPLRFEITVNSSLDKESGRFELVSVSFPCFATNRSLD